ncbi:MAG: hypothetical protein ACE37F_15860 [Nannocystaceae bacterium]|nr:hypothetical protein [bacterium]
MNIDTLLSLHHNPASAGRRASARRAEMFGEAIWIRGADPISPEIRPWPSSASAGEHLVVHVEPNAQARRAYAAWLLDNGAALPAGVAVTAYSREAAGLHRLWCLAAARLALPSRVRVEVRHDLVGIRLAQIALGFGVDTFAGPLESDRKLPLAGVTRPDEATREGIATLVRAAGLRPVFEPPANRVAS